MENFGIDEYVSVEFIEYNFCVFYKVVQSEQKKYNYSNILIVDQVNNLIGLLKNTFNLDKFFKIRQYMMTM